MNLDEIKTRHKAVIKSLADSKVNRPVCRECTFLAVIPDLIAEVERLHAREDRWGKLLEDAEYDIEQLNDEVNKLRGT